MRVLGEHGASASAVSMAYAGVVTDVPVWLIALILACAAPFLVGALQSLLERRLRRRTLDTIHQALSTRTDPNEMDRR